MSVSSADGERDELGQRQAEEDAAAGEAENFTGTSSPAVGRSWFVLLIVYSFGGRGAGGGGCFGGGDGSVLGGRGAGLDGGAAGEAAGGGGV